MSEARSDVRARLKKLTELGDERTRLIEVGIFNWTIGFCEENKITRNWMNPRFTSVYHNKCRSIQSNLDSKSYIGNRDLLERLKDGRVALYDLAFMKPHEVFPEWWKECLLEKAHKAGHVVPSKPSAMTSDYKCSRCGRKEVVFQEIQLRSGDEPASLIFMCLVCNNRWRIG